MKEILQYYALALEANKLRETEIRYSQKQASLKLGTAIREYRKDMGLSVRALAKEIGVSHTYLYEIESGVKRASHKTFRIISKYFMELSTD